MTSAPGSVAQARRIASQLTSYGCKGICITKDGKYDSPKIEFTYAGTTYLVAVEAAYVEITPLNKINYERVGGLPGLLAYLQREAKK